MFNFGSKISPLLQHSSRSDEGLVHLKLLPETATLGPSFESSFLLSANGKILAGKYHSRADIQSHTSKDMLMEKYSSDLTPGYF